MPGPNAVPIGRVGIKVVPITNRLRSDLKRAVKKASEGLEAKITVGYNRNQVDREMDKLKRRVNKDLNTNITPSLDRTATARTAARIGLLARDRRVNLIPKVDKLALAKAASILAALSGFRVIKDIGHDFGEFLRNLDKSVPKISAVALAIGGLASLSGTAVANIFAIASGIAQMAEAGLALPGILGGMAVGLTITIVALKDFKKHVPEVVTAWHKIESAITKNFWATAEKPIRNMVDRLLPQFVAGFASASSAIGGYFGSLAHDLAGKFDGPVKGMFKDLTKSVKIATKGTHSLAGIITTLGKAGAKQLPRLATWFNKVTDQFDKFLTKADKDGSLQRWIDNGIKHIKDFGNVLKGIGGIFSGLSKAMEKAGGSTLEVFGNTLNKISDVVNSNEFQNGLVEVFSAMFDAMHNIATVAGPQFKDALRTIGHTASNVLPGIGTAIGDIGDALSRLVASDSFNKGLMSFFDGIERGISAVTPSIGNLGGLFDSLGRFIGNFAAKLGPLVGAFIDSFAPAVSTVLDALNPLVNILTGALTQAMTSLKRPIADIASGLAGFADAIADPLKQALADAMPGLTDLLQTLGKLAKTALPALGKAFGGFLKTFGETVGQLAEFLNSILKPLVGFMGKNTGVVTAFFEAFIGYKILKTLASLGFTAGRAVTGLVSAMRGGTLSVGGFTAALALAGTAVAAIGFGISHLIEGGNGKFATIFSDAAANAQSFRDALYEANGAITQNIKLDVQKKLQDSGLAEKAAAAGISLTQLTTAVIGNDKQYNNLINTWKAGGKPAEATLFMFNLLHGEFKDGQVDAKKLADANSGLGKAFGNLSTDTQNATTKLRNEKDTADSLWTSLQKLRNQALNAEQSQLQLRDSCAALTSQVKEEIKAGDAGAKTFDVNTAAGRRNKESLLDLIQAANDHASKVKDQTGSLAKADKAFSTDIGWIKKAAKAAGLNADQVDALIKKYGLLPSKVETEVLAKNYGKTIKQIEAIEKKLKGLDGWTVQSYINITETLNAGKGTHIPGLVGAHRGATGGEVPGSGKKGVDSQWLYAAPGEWVIQYPAVRALKAAFGSGVMEAINRGRIPQIKNSAPPVAAVNRAMSSPSAASHAPAPAHSAPFIGELHHHASESSGAARELVETLFFEAARRKKGGRYA